MDVTLRSVHIPCPACIKYFIAWIETIKREVVRSIDVSGA